jgi:hypothetical protein
MDDLVCVRAVRRATAIVGEQLLAARLGVTTGQIKFWTKGAEALPDAAFARILDLIVDHEIAGLSRPYLDPRPQR